MDNPLVGHQLKNMPPAPTGEFTLYFNDNLMEELWMALAWSG